MENGVNIFVGKSMYRFYDIFSINSWKIVYMNEIFKNILFI